MEQALATMSRTASGRRSALLAEPLAPLKYTVMPSAAVALVLDGLDLAQPHRDVRAPAAG